MLLCGWFPPLGANASGAVRVKLAGGAYTLFPVPTDRAAGFSPSDGRMLVFSACECAGISLSSSVTVSEPPISPKPCNDSPGPCPGCMGARPCRSGNAKLLCPLPPYVVPSSENSAVFCDKGSSCPSHHAQPRGAKLNGNIRISATKGSAMITLSSRARENSEQRNDEVNAQIRLKIGVRLASANRADRLRRQRLASELAGIGFGWCASEHMTSRRA